MVMPIAKLELPFVPYLNKPISLFGIDKNKIEILGDIIEPLDVEWEANVIQARHAEEQEQNQFPEKSSTVAPSTTETGNGQAK